MNRIITIGREFGSGGRELGKRLADELGWAYYDQEIVREIVSRTELSEKYVEHVSEMRPAYAFPIHTALSFSFLDNPIWSQNQKVFTEQCDVIREAADRSDCIIVGRCADYILSDRDPFRIFVYADMPSKIQRCRNKSHDFDGLSDRELQRKIKEIDRNRAHYYDFFSGQEWGDRKYYDVCINTTDRSLKRIAHGIARMYHEEQQ